MSMSEPRLNITPKSSLILGLEAALFIAAGVYISILWLSLPYIQSSGGVALWHTGYSESLIRGGPFKNPQNIAFPAGAPIVFGASLSYIQYSFMRLFGVDGIASYSFTGTLFAFIALGGSYSLARALGAGRALALALAVALLSQSFYSLHIQGYGALGFGFAFLPGVCSLFHHLSWRKANLYGAIIYAAVVSVTMIFLAFLDGYTFVMALACGIAFSTSYILFDRTNAAKHFINFLIISGSSAFAYVLYSRYVPEDGLPGYPLNIFAYLSLHLPSMFRPTTGYSVLYDFLGLSVQRPPTTYVGAGLGNHESVFLTITAIALVLVSFGLRVSNVWRAVALFLIFGGLLMAIGPIVPESTGVVGTSEMTSIRAPIATSPAYPLYTMVPGLDQMRATYRWIAVVKLGVWILVGLVCSRLSKRGYGQATLAFGLVVVMMAEGSASLFRQWTAGRDLLVMATNLRMDLAGELTEHLPAESKLLVLPITNDFVIHSVAAKANMLAYNVGGDKNLLIANTLRPPIISRIAEVGPCFLRDLVEGAEQGKIDAVAFRVFDSHRGRYGWVWPPTAKEVEEDSRAASELSRNVPEAAIEKGKYFWFVDARRIDRSLVTKQCS